MELWCDQGWDDDHVPVDDLRVTGGRRLRLEVVGDPRLAFGRLETKLEPDARHLELVGRSALPKSMKERHRTLLEERTAILVGGG